MKLQKHRNQNVNAILGFGSLLCLALFIIRIYFSSSFYFGFLLWNLFLAWIPLLLSYSITSQEDATKSKNKIAVLFFLWLLFFPNSPYIITDLSHLKQMGNIPIWYDLVLIISFAWNGLLIGFVSLLEIQRFLTKKYSTSISWVLVISILFLSGFGIYLGRYQRWNSWDIVTNPIALALDIVDRLVNPLSHPRTIGVTILFTSFLLMSYLTIFVLINSKKHED